MEEISKRFEIVRLAIQLGDIDTVEIQSRKLRDMSLDDNLDEIISLLESRNYRQALFLMKNYKKMLQDDFFEDDRKEIQDNTNTQPIYIKQPHKASKEEIKKEVAEEKREETILPSPSPIKIITVDDLLKMSDKSKESISSYYDRPPIVQNEEITPENESKESEDIQDNSKSKDEENSTQTELPEPIYEYKASPEFNIEEFEKEVLSDTTTDESKSENIESIDTIEPTYSNPFNESMDRDDLESIESQENQDNIEETKDSDSESIDSKQEERENTIYPPMPHIELKFKNMLNQYPPIEYDEIICQEIYPMIDKIAQEEYSEQDIWNLIDEYQRYKEEGNLSCAAQILLLAAGTESQFAQFLLARELFSGEVLQKDHGEAFTQVKKLAEKNFPEAICDLGQFYEYGIGIGKDKKMALLLYEEAAEMGVARAKRHVERLKKSKGLFKIFKF